MTDILLVVVLVLLALLAVLQILVLRRKVGVDLSPLQTALQSVERSYERLERSVRDEIARNREEASNAAQKAREELAGAMKGVGDTLNQQLVALTKSNDDKLERVRTTVEQRLQLIQDDSGKRLEQVRKDSQDAAKALREEIAQALKGFNESLVGKHLDQMRATVDEKLQGTLEKRLGESFKQVSERLEQVHKGLGEMRDLATGVGDLKKVLTNVKTRGTFGEVQLGALLEQVFTPDQYGTNVATKGGSERVEFAIKLPGPGEDKDEPLWLPVDAKFPTEDYQRLVEAQEKADPVAAEAAIKALENRVKGCAHDIHDKYICPPKTTEFGILFLPTEGLFAEVMRRGCLAEYVQRECHVMIAGPTTLLALLNSLQMGFRTLAIQQRSSEVWNLLAAVKTEWTKYGAVLDKVQKKLQEASNTVDDANKRTRAIGRKLRDIQELPATEAGAVLMLEGVGADGDEEAE